MINLAFFFLIDGLDFFFLWQQLRLFHERIICLPLATASSVSWNNHFSILYQFNILCVQHVDFRLSGLERNKKFFEILTHMDNERHVCQCSLTYQDILHPLVTFSLIDSIFPFKSRKRRQCFKKYSFKFSYCSTFLTSTLSRLSQRVWQYFIT